MVLGHLYIAFSVKEIPLIKRSGILLGVCCGLLIPLSLSNLFLGALYPFRRPLYQCVLTGFVSGTFMSVCFVGSYLSLYKRRWSYSILIVVCFFNSIVVYHLAAVLQSVAYFWGLLTLSAKEFFVIKKCSTNHFIHVV